MTEERHKPRLAISLGDYNGIGPELIIRTLEDNRLTDLCTPIVFGSPKIISFYKKMLGKGEVNFNYINSPEQANHKRINLCICWNEETEIKPGQPADVAGIYAAIALKEAVKACLANHADALLTAPIDKNTAYHAENFPFRGHTDYFRSIYEGAKPMMMLVADGMRVGLATVHIPISEVAAKLSIDSIAARIEQINHTLKSDFGVVKPRIAVLGLNPHAGDNGLMGKEEEELIIPAINKSKEAGIMALGPYPSDGFFGSGQYRSFDAILAMYHDQGLIPFKMKHFDEGVNFTAGLSFVRTSPDHGTAYDLAGKGKASLESFREALYSAIDIWRTRNKIEHWGSNPLELQPLKRERFRLEI